MIVFKRRLLFWLIKAYVKKWGKFILLSFLVGLGIFFVLKSSFGYIVAALTGLSKQTVGVVGSYTIDTLPKFIVKDVSRGLTQVDNSGTVKPDIASSWEIGNNGKIYILHLKKGIKYIDGTPVTAKTIPLSFADVKIDKPDDYTMVFHLKDTYSPFLVSLSRPIFRNGLTGIGLYKIKNIKLNGSFIESLSLTSPTQTPALKVYQFYPTQDALKVAYTLGEISVAQNLIDLSFEKSSLSKFPNTQIQKGVNYDQLVTLFYNTQDKNLSDKRLRDGLSYALPNSFAEGERAYSPIPPTSWAYQGGAERSQDLAHATLLLNASLGDVSSSSATYIITTLPRYERVAQVIQENWEKVGIKTHIQVVDTIPPVFQMYLGSFNVPDDPDQYSLWHSFQGNNISNYRSLRIDKLLEDGRKTLSISDRIKSYADFQKYIIDDQPASFLFFPYNYTVTRD